MVGVLDVVVVAALDVEEEEVEGEDLTEAVEEEEDLTEEEEVLTEEGEVLTEVGEDSTGEEEDLVATEVVVVALIVVDLKEALMVEATLPHRIKELNLSDHQPFIFFL